MTAEMSLYGLTCRIASALNRRFRSVLSELRVVGKPVRALEPNDDSETEIIVSLTSYGFRLKTVHIAIRSLMQQTVPPNRIILWLDNESAEIDLPLKLLALREFGLEIEKGCRNLKGHKKYYYAMKRYPGSIIITVDDDLIYPSDTIETLINAHELYPESIVARRVHRITFGGNLNAANIKPYLQWDSEWMSDNPFPSKQLLATTGAGVLYPPNSAESLLYDEATIASLALNADDIWMKAAEISAGYKVVYAPNDLPMPPALRRSQSEGLLYQNIDGGGNDSVMESVIDYFGFTEADFRDRLS